MRRECAWRVTGYGPNNELELTYQAHLALLERQGGFTVLLQPDHQYIINPGAVTTTPNALVGGVRCTARF